MKNNTGIVEILKTIQAVTRPNPGNKSNDIKTLDLSRGMLISLIYYFYPDEKISGFFRDEFINAENSGKFEEYFKSFNFNADELNDIKNSITFSQQTVNNKSKSRPGKLMLIELADNEFVEKTDLTQVLDIVADSCNAFFKKYSYLPISLLNEISTTSSQFLLSCAFSGIFQNDRANQEKLLDIIEKYLEFNTHKLYMFSLIEENDKGACLFMKYNKDDELCRRALKLIGRYYEKVFEGNLPAVEIGKKLGIWVKSSNITNSFIENNNSYDAGLWSYIISHNGFDFIVKTIKSRFLTDIPDNLKSASVEYLKHLLSLVCVIKDNEFRILYHIKSDEKYNKDFKKLIMLLLRNLDYIANSSYKSKISLVITFLNNLLEQYSKYYSVHTEFFEQVEAVLSQKGDKEPYNKINLPKYRNINLKKVCGDFYNVLKHESNAKIKTDTIYQNLLAEIPASFAQADEIYRAKSLYLMVAGCDRNIFHVHGNPQYNEKLKEYFEFLVANFNQFEESYSSYEKKIRNFIKYGLKQFYAFDESRAYAEHIKTVVDCNKEPFKSIFYLYDGTAGVHAAETFEDDVRKILNGDSQNDFHEICSRINVNVKFVVSNEHKEMYSDFIGYVLANHGNDTRCIKTILCSAPYCDFLSEEVKAACREYSKVFLTESFNNKISDFGNLGNALKHISDAEKNDGYYTAVETAMKTISNQEASLTAVNILINCIGVEALTQKLIDENNTEKSGHIFTKSIIKILRNPKLRKEFGANINLNKSSFFAFVGKLFDFEVFGKIYVGLQKAFWHFAKRYNFLKEKLSELVLKISNNPEMKSALSEFFLKESFEELDFLDINKISSDNRMSKEQLIYGLCEYHKNEPARTAVLCIRGLALLLGQLAFRSNNKDEINFRDEKILARRKLLFKTVVANPCIREAAAFYCSEMMKYSFEEYFDSEIGEILKNIAEKKKYPKWFGAEVDLPQSDCVNEVDVEKDLIITSSERKSKGTRAKLKEWWKESYKLKDSVFVPDNIVLITQKDGEYYAIDGSKEINTCKEINANFKIKVMLYTPFYNNIEPELAQEVSKATDKTLQEVLFQIKGERLLSSCIPDSQRFEVDKELSEGFRNSDILEQLKINNNNIEILNEQIIQGFDIVNKKLDKIIDTLCDSVATELNFLHENLSNVLDEDSYISNSLDKITKTINENIQNYSCSKNEYNKSLCYFKGLFGEYWVFFEEYTRRSLVSSYVLLNGLNEQKDRDKLDFSGPVVALCSALENEIKRYFFSGVQKYLLERQTEISEWPGQLNYLNRKENKYEKDNGNTFTLGSFSAYLGFKEPKKSPKIKESDWPKLRKIYGEYMIEKTGNKFFSIDSLKDLSARVDDVASNYRNKAAHASYVNGESAEKCFGLIVPINKAAEETGKIEGILLELIKLFNP